MKHEKTEKQPRIHGNAVVMVLRTAYQKGGQAEVFKVAYECTSGFTLEQVMRIATGKATVDGNNIDGLEYREV